MKYMVDENFLREYRRIFEKYADHLSYCDVVAGRRFGSSPELDYARCTCGFSSSIKGLHEQEVREVFKAYMKGNPRLGTQENDRQIRLDKERRKLVENKHGKSFTDAEWLRYKLRKK